MPDGADVRRLRDHRRFPATADGAAAIDNWLEELGGRWGLPSKPMFRARVCVSEIAANAIEHGGAAAEGEFEVAVEADGRRIGVEWSDGTRGFDPTAPRTGAPEPAAAGGRGLALVRAYTDEVSYVREHGRNIVRMRFPAVPSPVT